MEHLPFYIPVVFIAATILTLFFLYKSSQQSRVIAIMVLLWLALQGFIGLSGFYRNTDLMPPRFIWALGPPLLAIILLFLIRRGRAVLDSWHL